MTNPNRTTDRLNALYNALSGFNEPQPISALLFHVNWSLDLDDHFTTNDSLRAFIRANLPADCITKQGGRLLVSLRGFAQPEEIAAALRARDGETYPILLSDETESELRRELWLQRDYALYQSLKWAEQSGVIEPVYGGVYGTMVRVARTTAPAMPEPVEQPEEAPAPEWVNIPTGMTHNQDLQAALNITPADHAHAMREHVIWNKSLMGIIYKAGSLADGRVLVQRVDRWGDNYKYLLMNRDQWQVWQSSNTRGDRDPETGRYTAA